VGITALRERVLEDGELEGAVIGFEGEVVIGFPVVVVGLVADEGCEVDGVAGLEVGCEAGVEETGWVEGVFLATGGLAVVGCELLGAVA
jgi:hypothetical protein